MKVIPIFEVPELAQNFVYAPEIEQRGEDTILFYDYETDSGTYAWKSIIFKNSLGSRRIKESEMEEYIVGAYNDLVQVEDSDWIKKFPTVSNPNEYKHFLIYFDDFGIYEFLAKSAEKGDNQGREWKMPELVE